MPDEKVLVAFTLRVAMSIGDACVLHLVDDAGVLHLASLHHRRAEATALLASWLTGTPAEVARSLPAEVVRSGQALFVPVAEREHLQRFAPRGGDLYLKHSGVQSLLILPVPGEAMPAGAVSLLRDRGTHPYTTEDRQVVRRLIAGLGRALGRPGAAGLADEAARSEGEPGQPHGTRPRRAPAAGEAPDRHTILVVEDETAVRELVREILQREGYDVLEAENAEKALVLLGQREASLDLLLTDMVMPGMSGAALAEIIRERHPDLRALFMSGYVDQTMVPRQGDEAAPFLQKPFTLDALVRSVRAVLTDGAIG
ncbi:MAG TPA: response regulator [Vicinamibacterales bacterium]|nr:response regulator [Vicinamibacterales bacterium]